MTKEASSIAIIKCYQSDLMFMFLQKQSTFLFVSKKMQLTQVF